jgi:hypothetical protein
MKFKTSWWKHFVHSVEKVEAVPECLRFYLLFGVCHYWIYENMLAALQVSTLIYRLGEVLLNEQIIFQYRR